MEDWVSRASALQRKGRAGIHYNIMHRRVTPSRSLLTHLVNWQMQQAQNTFPKGSRLVKALQFFASSIAQNGAGVTLL